MDFKEKRHAKKMARRFFTLGYGMLIVLAIFAIGGLLTIVLMDGNTEPRMSVTVGILIFFGMMISSVVLGMVGQRFLNKRVAYKQGIAIYRQNTFFTRAIRLVLAGDKKSRNKAVDTYELLEDDSPLRRFVFAFIVTSSYYSKDKKVAEKGKNRLESILETFDPEKVDFNKKISLI